jgi:lipoic acid synthetase
MPTRDDGRRIPDWIRFQIPGGENAARLRGVIKKSGLHTVCMEARCPNVGECMGCGTATFLIMGDTCTRNCRYCSVSQGTPRPLDSDEPSRIGGAVRSLGLRYAVITSVTRDDLPDGGAGYFAETVRAVRGTSPRCRVELLVPDFLHAAPESLQKVFSAGPDVLNHNIEVAEPLFERLRPTGDYRRSLRLLREISGAGFPAKSGLMVGFGETMDDITKTLEDLQAAGVTILTVGQYLRSKRDGFPVARYYHPDEFHKIEETAREIGFPSVRSGPLVRSSYRAGEDARSNE